MSYNLKTHYMLMFIVKVLLQHEINTFQCLVQTGNDTRRADRHRIFLELSHHCPQFGFKYFQLSLSVEFEKCGRLQARRV
ncbi:hypothetical protein EXN66_Car020706 [Channa argus]|uniref:Uncharacterized protein n=1 Tax=Channa argus TaxID=215402 RepID=A0A6G1QR35_CHAAH|nr:hypothetical protein EXN66_Car020706 [Channa argus]